MPKTQEVFYFFTGVANQLGKRDSRRLEADDDAFRRELEILAPEQVWRIGHLDKEPFF